MEKYVCKTCGNKIDKEDMYCRFCGANIEEQRIDDETTMQYTFVSNINLISDAIKKVASIQVEADITDLVLVIDILDYFKNTGNCSIMAIQKKFNMPFTKARIIMSALVDTGYINKKENGYELNYTTKEVTMLKGVKTMLQQIMKESKSDIITDEVADAIDELLEKLKNEDNKRR